MVLARVCGSYSTTYFILQYGHMGKNECATLVPAPIGNLSSTNPTKAQEYTQQLTPDPSDGSRDILLLTVQPKIHLIARAPHHYSFQPKLLQITKLGYIQKLQPKIGAHHQARVHLEFPIEHPSTSPSWVPIEIFPGNLHLMPQIHTHSDLLTRSPSISPSCGPFEIYQEISI